MSTHGAIRQFERSWSEENLFQIQTREKISDLEANLELCKTEREEREAKMKELEKKLENKANLIEKFHIQVYDLQRETKILQKRLDRKGKRAAKPKKAIAKNKQFKATKFVDPNEDKEKAKREEWEKESNIALQFLHKEADSTKKKRESHEDVNENKHEHDDHDHDDDDDIVFDLESVAKIFPNMPISEVLRVEKNFVSADANNSGLIEEDEMLNVIDIAKLDMNHVKKILKEEKLDLDEGIDFIGCLKLFDRLRLESLSHQASSHHSSTSTTKNQHADTTTSSKDFPTKGSPTPQGVGSKSQAMESKVCVIQ
eukprot:m.51294 g.51294  ORF g.51294 m.51294 type:complete len:313 (-) comp7556_c0_seq2:150-1088(-)